MQGKKIRISFLDILIYISLTFLCMQFFTLGNLIGFCKFFDSLGLKHIFMMLTVFVGFVSDLRKGKLSIKTFTYEIKMVVIAIVSLVLISFVYMAFNGYANYWISQVYFLAIPLLFAYTIFKNDFSKQLFNKLYPRYHEYLLLDFYGFDSAFWRKSAFVFLSQLDIPVRV